MRNPELSIIIVSYNTKVLTAQTIESVLATRGSLNLEIIVVDNASKDGSGDYLAHRYGKKIQLIRRQDNAGFAIANNVGIGAATGKFILLLNSDTIVHAGALGQLVSTMASEHRFGILSCRLENPDGSYQPQGGALPTLPRIAAWWLWPLPGQIPFIDPYQDASLSIGTGHPSLVTRGWVGGTAMLIRRETIDQIGKLDEQIFMYAEDVDFCLRAHSAGWQIGLLSTATITHHGSASGSADRALVGEVRGLLYLWGKHYPAWQKPVLCGIIALGAGLRWLLFGILGGHKARRVLYEKIFHLVF